MPSESIVANTALGVLYRSQGLLDEAARYYDRVLRLDSGNRMVRDMKRQLTEQKAK